MAKAKSSLVMRYIITDFFRELLLFPVWWYTKGLRQVSKYLVQSIRSASQIFGLMVWVKNLFVPMYGETGFAGRAISFFIRLVMIIGRGFGVLVWALINVLFFVVYLIALPLFLLSFIYQLGTVPFI